MLEQPIYTAIGCLSCPIDLYTQQKRPVYTVKEPYIHSKRGLYTQQKRPVYTAKET